MNYNYSFSNNQRKPITNEYRVGSLSHVQFKQVDLMLIGLAILLIYTLKK